MACNIKISLFRLGSLLFLLFAVVVFPTCVMAKILHHKEVTNSLYLERDGEPLWIENFRLNRSGRELIEILGQSWMNGLNPSKYHVEKINKFFDYFDYSRRVDDEYILQLELLLTDGYINYVRDLSGMRIAARDMGLNPDHWRQRISAREALSFLPDNIDNIADFLLLREPQGETYQQLKSKLTELVEGQDFSDSFYEPLVFEELVRPGGEYGDIPKLRVRLGLSEVGSQGSNIYDSDLVKAVMEFQADKGLKADGLIGKKTLVVLNQTPMDKIRQIIVNMERLRWIGDEKPDRFIVVNIPSATLWAIDNGKVVIEMPVVVGSEKRQTSSFVAKFHGVRFNPTWTVPPTIKEEDILPNLQKNPAYLGDKGMELYDGYDEDALTLDPSIIDWTTISKNELHSLRMVQVAGAHNPLGFIRILMPNEYDIYLHDTNHKELFGRSNRAESSGCVRLNDPEKIALFALEKSKGWGEKRMRQVLDDGETKDFYTPDRMPIYLLYYTTWLGDKNQVIYGSDIYGHDKTLLHLLEKLDGFQIIRDNEYTHVQAVD